MMFKVTPYLVHSASVVYYFFLFVYTMFILVPPPHMLRDNFVDSIVAGPGQFLTAWNIILQVVYFTIALLDDFISSNNYVPSKVLVIRRIRDYVFCSLVFPTSLFVGVAFWSLAAVDRGLVIPKIFEEYFTLWYNHALHTNVVAFIILETLTTFHRYPPMRSGLSAVTVLFATYIVWLHIIYFHEGLWVYPFLEFFSWPSRIVFFIICTVGANVCYFGGEFLNNAVWAERTFQLKTSEKRRAM